MPLDVDVTLPPSGDGPFPTIVMLHGYGGSKTDYETEQSSTTYHWNAEYFAKRGYAVVSPTARGFGRSCGAPASRTPDCAQGWIHLADQRYEARDTQTLLGLLADEGIAKPGALGVTGISYGGGQSLELAYLRDRIRRADGSFAPWKQPEGHAAVDRRRLPALAVVGPRQRAAAERALPRLPRVGPDREPRAARRLDPVLHDRALRARLGGRLLRAAGPRPRRRPDDLERDASRRASPTAPTRARSPTRSTTYHQGFGISGTPAPLLLLGGWTDDLFPSVGAAARLQRAARRQPGRAGVAAARRPRSRARLQQGQRRPRLQRRRLGVLRRLPARRRHAARARQRHRLHADLPAGGARRRPVRRLELARAAPRRRRCSARAPRRPSARAAATRRPPQAYDPISGGGDACHSSAKETAPGTAYLRRPRGGRLHAARPPDDQRRRSPPAAPTASSPRACGTSRPAARRCSSPAVSTGCSTTSAARSRSSSTATATASTKGHMPRLELLGRDAPYYRASNGSFSVAVSKLRVVLPVAERPGCVPGVVSPPGALQRLGRKRPRLTLTARYEREAPHAARERAPDSPQGRLEAPRLPRPRDDPVKRASTRCASASVADPPQDLPLHLKRIRLRTHGKRVTVRVRFGGNAALAPRKAKARVCASATALGGSFPVDGGVAHRPEGFERAPQAAAGGQGGRLGHGPAAPSRRRRKKAGARIAGLKVTESVCPYCAVGCGQVVYTRGGELIDIEGNPRSPINQGTLCPKGSASRQLVQQPGRLTKVKYRRARRHRVGGARARDGDGHDRRARRSPPARTAGRTPTTRAGASTARWASPTSAAPRSTTRRTTSSRSSSRRWARSRSRTRRAYDTAPRSPVWGPRSGAAAPPRSSRTSQNADCILIQGSNMAEAHPVGFRWVMKARERGATIIHVDPRFSAHERDGRHPRADPRRHATSPSSAG